MKPQIDLRLLIDNSINEKLIKINKSNESIKRQTKAIASSYNKPIIDNVFGTRLNTMCYHFESYQEPYFKKLMKL